MDEAILQAILGNQEKEIKSVLVTIIRTKGSTPRELGTQMLITENGKALGTVGGGSVERYIFEKALALMTMESQAQAEILRLSSNEESGSDSLPTCGGNLDVLVENVQNRELWRLAAKLQKNSRGAFIVTALYPPFLKSIVDSEGKSLVGAENKFGFLADLPDISSKRNVEVVALNKEQSYLLEPILENERLLILGAGHVAREVANYAKSLDFKITVIDEREEFAKTEFFPDGCKVICSDLESGILNFQPNEDTYVVIATWSHQTDAVCVKEVLKNNTKYVGMLGGNKKVSAILQKLQDDGYPSRSIARLHAPIGLKIGAQTPSEIAVSIMAEIISVRREVKKMT